MRAEHVLLVVWEALYVIQQFIYRQLIPLMGVFALSQPGGVYK